MRNKKGERGLIDTKALYGVIVSRGKTQQDVALAMGITPKTFYQKMKKGVFGSNEIEAMIEILGIENPTEIFFARKST